MTPHSRIQDSTQRSDRPQCKHLFHKITSLDMIRLYLTTKDKDKDKDTGHSPKLGTSQGNTVTQRYFTPCPRRSRSCCLRRNASMEGVLQSHMRSLSPESCMQHPNPCA